MVLARLQEAGSKTELSHNELIIVVVMIDRAY